MRQVTLKHTSKEFTTIYLWDNSNRSRVPKSLLWIICLPTGIYTTERKGQSPSIVLEMCISIYCLSNQQIFIE